MYIPTWFMAIIVVALFLIYRNRDKKGNFRPIKISVQPKWSELLKDYKVVSDNSWDKEIPEGKRYDVMRDGINFTILEPGLIYDDDWHHFKTSVDFKRRIDQLSPDDSSMRLVGIYIKASLEGYELGIRTPESHLKSFKEKSLPGDDSDLVKVATIPYSAILFDNKTNKQRKRLFADLAKYGWRMEEMDPELSLVFPERALEHKYFSIVYVDI
jgi:hypothetical protein